jgi:hypothetical protein
VVDRLDEERIEILRSWGAGLASDHREELRAAGKAITVLIEEIDRLQVDLWSARVEPPGPSEQAGQAEQVEPPSPASVLRDRLTRAARTT